MICGAKTRLGSPCKKYAIEGKRRCRLHGGVSLSGVEHPNYLHGRRSKAYMENARRVRAEISFFEQLGNEYGWFME
jgi:glucans biosynthesis protein